MCSALEIEALDRVEYAGTALGKTIRIDGTGGDPRDADGILSVIVFEMFETEEPSTIHSADAKRLFGHLLNFVRASLRKEFRDSPPPEAAAGTAQMIAIYSARIDAVLAGSMAEVPITYNIWDLTRLHRIESWGMRAKIMARFDRDFGGALPTIATSGDDAAFPSYLAVIRGRQLADIYDIWGARMLETNLRSFIQVLRKSVNDGIRNTIIHEPEMFFSYNNGLSATADCV